MATGISQSMQKIMLDDRLGKGQKITKIITDEIILKNTEDGLGLLGNLRFQ